MLTTTYCVSIENYNIIGTDMQLSIKIKIIYISLLYIFLFYNFAVFSSCCKYLLCYVAVSTPALVSVVLGCSVFLASVGAVTCLCYGRRQSPSQVKLRRDRPMTFQRKPVKSPLPTTHYLRKSPSPTTPVSEPELF